MENGRIEARLDCIDAGEYGDKCIFPHDFLVERVEKLQNLYNSFEYMILVDDPERIQSQVEKVINKIRELLQQWKEITVPAEKEHIILI